ncbi:MULTISPECIES: SpoIIE family protein phosphatase [unclassified Frankia]|uniref:SpoIIE family protein phosphatase n=1 Tax=unclassified Frankia TaxID=2632575 RepID=UPI002AD40028|nr:MULTISPECIES: SpoIIE family protein phosphatase [unclassified Frankia]
MSTPPSDPGRTSHDLPRDHLVPVRRSGDRATSDCAAGDRTANDRTANDSGRSATCDARSSTDADALDHLLLALDAAQVGVWEWDIVDATLRWDRRTGELHGIELDSFGGTLEAFLALVHPDDVPNLQARIATALATGGFILEEYRVIRPDGSPVWLQWRGRAITDTSGQIVRIAGVCADTTELRSGREQAGRAMQHVSDGVAVYDCGGRFVFVNAVASRLFGRDPSELIGMPMWEVYPEVVGSAFEQLYLRALRTQVPAETEGYYGPLAGCFEIRLFPAPDGMTVYFRNVDERRRAEAQRAELITSLSSALDRARKLFDVTAALGQALTVPDVADVMARSARHDLGADIAAIMLVGEEGRIRMVSPTTQSDRVNHVLERVSGRATAATPEVLRTARARFDASRADYLADYPHVRTLLEVALLAGMAHIPMIISGRPIGVILLGWTTDQTFDADERAFLTTLAGTCAHAIERARLYERQRSVTEALQQAILPRHLPNVAGVELTARYLPAGRDVDVGGDWYDALTLPDGSLMLIVGDVGGHGLRAATVMAELKHAARAYAMLGQTPAAITGQLSASLTASDSDVYATAVVACLNVTNQQLTWSCAGHPPLLLLDGADATFLEEVHGPILGAVDNCAYRQDTVTLPARARLLLYSDGLIERRDTSISERLDFLSAVAAGSHAMGLDAACDRLLAEVAGPSGREDDLCLLAADLLGDR